MKTIFRKLSPFGPVCELKIPETFCEKLNGLNAYKIMPSHCGVLYPSPCTLHTYGFKKPIWLVLLDSNFTPISTSMEFRPNHILLCTATKTWIAEFAEQPEHNGTMASTSSTTNIHFWSVRAQLKTLLLALCMTLVSIILATHASAGNLNIKIPVGESKEINLGDAPRSIDISQPDVIDVQRIGETNKILITALRSGTSKLTAHFQQSQSKQWHIQAGLPLGTGEIAPTLSAGSLVRLAREIQKRVGLETVIDNGRVVLFGQIQNEAQVIALSALCLGREECLPRYSSTSAADQALANLIRSIAQDNGFANLEITPSAGGILVRGSLENEIQLESMRKVLRSTVSRFQEAVIIDNSGGPLIETELTFFRLNRARLLALGLTTEAKANQGGHELARGELPNFLAQIKNGPTIQMKFPDLLLNALAQKGVVQQLAKPTIVIASGGQGEIQTGGEILFRSQGHNQKFFTQTFGLRVYIQPKVNANKRILQKIDIKISHPSSQENPNALVEMNQSLLSTEVNCRSDEQFLLTKINQQFERKSVTKIPILGHLPIIGELFKSREINAEENELWIALKSRIANNEMIEQIEIKDKLNSEHTDAHWLD